MDSTCFNHLSSGESLLNFMGPGFRFLLVSDLTASIACRSGMFAGLIVCTKVTHDMLPMVCWHICRLKYVVA